VQLRFKTELTFEQYATGRGWEGATLPSCPFHPEGGCGFCRHGSYMRKVPGVAMVARCYCPRECVTVGLLPDFYASRLPGTLDALEEAVARVEDAKSVEQAAQEARPAEAQDAVTLATAVRWVRLRVQLVTATLAALLALCPGRFGSGAPTVGHFRAQLGTTRALVSLRGVAEAHLHALPMPLGLLGPPTRQSSGRLSQQSPGPDGPPAPG